MQTIRTDQQVPFGRTAVFEVDPHPVARIDHPHRTGVALDAIGRKAFQQTVEQDATWDLPNRSAEPVHDRGQIDGGERTACRCRDPHGGQQLTGPVHVDAELLENCGAVGPDGHRAATWPHIRSLFEDSDVMSVAQ